MGVQGFLTPIINQSNMKVSVIIEKANDGYYSCYVDEELDGFGLIGHGETAEDAKKDMLSSYQEMKEMFQEEGKDIPELEFAYKYDMQAFFNYFSFLNITKIGELAGINSSLLRQYASGTAMAGQKQYDKIKKCISKITQELSAATF